MTHLRGFRLHFIHSGFVYYDNFLAGGSKVSVPTKAIYCNASLTTRLKPLEKGELLLIHIKAPGSHVVALMIQISKRYPTVLLGKDLLVKTSLFSAENSVALITY